MFEAMFVDFARDNQGKLAPKSINYPYGEPTTLKTILSYSLPLCVCVLISILLYLLYIVNWLTRILEVGYICVLLMWCFQNGLCNTDFDMKLGRLHLKLAI